MAPFAAAGIHVEGEKGVPVVLGDLAAPEVANGDAIRQRLLAFADTFFAFYMDTGSRKWGHPYLNRKFFSLLGERLGDDVLLILASRDGRDIAGALNMVGSDTLYGRYWGALEDHAFLHFEVCYYQAIDFAIANRLVRVEAGAQGAHKLARGYVPQITHSAHYIANPALRDAVARFVGEEARQVEFENRLLAGHAPFRRDHGQ